MKKLYSILIFSVIALCSFAQDSTSFKSRFYISVESGYSLGLGRQFDNLPYLNTVAVRDTNIDRIGATFTSTRAKGGALGKGIFSGLTIGYSFNKIDLGISIQDLQNSPISYTYTYTTNAGDNGWYREHTHAASAIRISPFMKMKCIFNDKWSSYAMLAPTMGVNAGIDVTEKEDNTKLPDSEKEWKYQGGMAWGAISRFGSEYRINNNFKVYADLQLAYLQFTPDRGTLIIYTEDGANKLPSLTEDQRTILFKDEYSVNSVTGSYFDDKGRTIAFKQTYNLSSAGIMVGVTYNF